ncbi:MAG: DNA mismatch repair endonuclease MutL [Chloroflexota bacterium]|nr:MAG: DNA mismatch repair endonuclease MutL [Chloroflexota bacterium]
MSIHILPPEVASQIAAGEVVERPASVVKELVENSLDAGATQISITVKEAGRGLIEVADDGSGISFNDLPLTVSRHATSKLSSAEDLFHIATLGFRGEALASIGSVSQLTLTSRAEDAAQGGKLRVDGGHVSAVEPIGVPIGTVVKVADLFYNVPARLKFLKKDVTERRHIEEFVARYALAYPHIRFQLRQEDRFTVQTSGSGDRREVLASLYSVELAQQMLEVLAEYEQLTITGFTSAITFTRSNRREITLFINGRWIQDTALVTAVVQAYHTFLMVGRYPQSALFLELPPEMVDVNVHPTKAEVRFRDRDQVFRGVQRAVRRALLAHTPVPDIRGKSFETPGTETGFYQEDQVWSPPDPGYQQVQLTWDPLERQLDDSRVPLLRLIGQVAATYLVAEGPDGLYLVDQHAAHERILFEHFLEQRQTSIPSQVLLEPAVVEFSAAEASLINDQLPVLEKLGFQVEEFGLNTFLVRGIPQILAGVDPSAALRVLVEDFEEDETPLQAELEAKIIARVCKRAAVKGGQSLSVEEQRALLDDLEGCQSPRTCPHGRPTMIHLSVDLLERQFGRRGAR